MAMRLCNAKLEWATPSVVAAEFFMALTSEVICTHECRLPCSFTGDELPRLLQLGRPFNVLVDKSVQPSHEVVIKRRMKTRDMTNAGDDVIKVAVVLLPYIDKLVNMRMDPRHHLGQIQQSGWRRWYKEFWEFAASGTFVHPTGAVSGDQVDLYKIYACILQYKAAEFRARAYQEDEYLPRGRCSAAGCIHAIVRRTRVSHHDVTQFVSRWCDLNSGVLVALAEKISKEFKWTFFS